jgi:hypothetical protein
MRKSYAFAAIIGLPVVALFIALLAARRIP